MEEAPTREAGFELHGEFYRWSATDVSKDLMLIDRIFGRPAPEFFRALEDDEQRARTPVLLSLVATSIRAEHPDWSIDRILEIVYGFSWGEDLVMIGGEEEEEEAAESPPEGGGSAPPTSSSSAGESSPSPTQEEPLPSETLRVIQR